MLVTLFCAAMTVIFFIISQVRITVFARAHGCLNCLLVSGPGAGEWGPLALGGPHGAGEQRLLHWHLRHVEPVRLCHHVPLRTVAQTLWRRAVECPVHHWYLILFLINLLRKTRLSGGRSLLPPCGQSCVCHSCSRTQTFGHIEVQVYSRSELVDLQIHCIIGFEFKFPAFRLAVTVFIFADWFFFFLLAPPVQLDEDNTGWIYKMQKAALTPFPFSGSISDSEAQASLACWIWLHVAKVKMKSIAVRPSNLIY